MTSVLPDIYGYEIIKLTHRLIIILSWPNPLTCLSPPYSSGMTNYEQII